MCRPASMVVAMGPKAFSSRKTDKHIEIRKEFGLPENGVGRVTSVQVELVPDENDFSRPLPEWRFVVDQDELPEWWDADAAEKECRHELEKWASLRLIRDGDVRSIDPSRHEIRIVDSEYVADIVKITAERDAM